MEPFAWFLLCVAAFVIGIIRMCGGLRFDFNFGEDKKKEEPLITELILSDLWKEVAKIAQLNGKTGFSASASMNANKQIELKAYIDGFNMVSGITIEEICAKLYASNILLEKVQDNKKVMTLGPPKMMVPVTAPVKKEKIKAYEEVIIA